MSSNLVLALPDFTQDFILTSNASDNGYGAVLEQTIDNLIRIIAYYSRCYTPSQKNYAISEKE